MAFANRIGNLLKKSVTSSPSLYQVIRCMSSSKIFIGGLSYGTDDQSLREAFTSYGEVVEGKVIMDRETGRSRGFGFVTFTSNEEASAAISGFDGKDLHGRMVRVNYANERTGGFRGGYGGGGYGGGGYGGGGGGYGGRGGYGAGGGYDGGSANNYGGDNYNTGPAGGGGGYGGGSYGSGGGGSYGGGSYGSGGGGGGGYGGSAGGYDGASAGGGYGVAGGGGGSDNYVSGADGGFGGGSGGYGRSSGFYGGSSGGNYNAAAGGDSKPQSSNFGKDDVGYGNDNQDDLLEDDFKGDNDDEPDDYANKQS
ncbi:unnamed protein product [Musa acuminata subsp. malaccensis]|uniref:(wild Malaysian banana) hypothetical protein n=1 Tax=Musa acuminata subsp. malaccensis TaxID=214687 RepID=A0A8D7ALD3_MUSAM|nr:unnamed protein product [Musa acuminata subsp. malaccensis]